MSVRQLAALSLLLTFAAFAQEPPAKTPQPAPSAATPTPPPADDSVERMKKLAFLTGHWKGEAWILMGREKAWAIQREWVSPKAGGKVVLIEGLGKEKRADGSEGDTVHEALALISWDAEKKVYRFDAHVAGRPSTQATLEVTGENSVVWGYTTPRGQIRFAISLTPKGEWHEIGEMTRDGQTWMKFFEMTLLKQ